MEKADKTSTEPEYVASEAQSVEEEEFDDEEFDDKDYTPTAITDLLEAPPLLPHESEDQFVALFESFEQAANPKTVQEYWLVWYITNLTWEVMRYSRMKIAVMLNHQRGAVESLFRKTHDTAALKNAGDFRAIEADANAKKFFADPAYRESASQKFVAAGFSPDGVEAEAFVRSLTALATIERLIVSAQKRLTQFLKELEKRCDDRQTEERAAKLRETASAAIASVS